MRKMGWRSGKGVGPMRSFDSSDKVADSSSKNKVYGCSLPSADSALEASLFHEVSPDDFEGFNFSPKHDLHGLGYFGLQQTSLLDPSSLLRPDNLKPIDSTKFSLAKGRSKQASSLGIGGQAFGVGALEDEDADIYAVEDIRRFNFALESGSDDMGGSGISAGDLNAFVEASVNSRVFRKYFPPPVLPKNFVPKHRQTRFTSIQQSSKDIDNIKGVSNRLAEMRKAKSAPLQSNAFSDNPEKWERFLWYQRCKQAGFEPKCPANQTEWEWNQEKQEFDAELACQSRDGAVGMNPEPLTAFAGPDLLKSIADQMKARFKAPSDKEEVLVSKSSEPTIADVDRLKAVEMKMFGTLTRRKFEWHPDNVLCRRMNVPNPYPDSKIVGIPGMKKGDIFLDLAGPSSLSGLGSMPLTTKDQEPVPTSSFTSIDTSFDSNTNTSGIHRSKSDGSSLSSDAVTKPKKAAIDLPSANRPSMDIFKAVFDASDSNDESEDEKVPGTSGLEAHAQQNLDNVPVHADDMAISSDGKPPFGLGEETTDKFVGDLNPRFIPVSGQRDARDGSVKLSPDLHETGWTKADDNAGALSLEFTPAIGSMGDTEDSSVDVLNERSSLSGINKAKVGAEFVTGTSRRLPNEERVEKDDGITEPDESEVYGPAIPLDVLNANVVNDDTEGDNSKFKKSKARQSQPAQMMNPNYTDSDESSNSANNERYRRHSSHNQSRRKQSKKKGHRHRDRESEGHRHRDRESEGHKHRDRESVRNDRKDQHRRRDKDQREMAKYHKHSSKHSNH